ncbi:MAG: PDZ domain-containing protein [Ruminococcaceae bacterium]|nr:PDZ domain-containing protein [Oscillospiraceae bacterium]
MDEQHYTNEYRTGRTSPQKNRSGVIAVLLILVIFLGGVVSGLGFMNIHLFRQLKESAATAPISFAQGGTLPAEGDTLSLTLEGMTFQELPALYQQLYDLPQGLYITQVARESKAKALGITPGDVLLTVDGTPVTQLDTLQTLFGAAGEQAILTLHRKGQTVTLTLGK